MDTGCDVRVCGNVKVLSGAAARAAKRVVHACNCPLQSDAELLYKCRKTEPAVPSFKRSVALACFFRRHVVAQLRVFLLHCCCCCWAGPNPTTARLLRTPAAPPLNFDCLNARSTADQGARLRDVIESNQLDVLAVNKTWIAADDPDSIRLGTAPPGLVTTHFHCSNQGFQARKRNLTAA